MKNIFIKAIILSRLVSLISPFAISQVFAETSQPSFEALEAEPLSNQNEQLTSEKREFIPATPEVIAATKAKVEDFDCTTVTDVPVSECEALVALYESTNGAGWTNSENWLSSEPVAKWYGIQVNDATVRNIDLYDNNLVGPLPDEIGNLIGLNYLAFVSNQLTGPIPETIGNLQSLSVLYLFRNFLSGSLPSTFGALTNLEAVNLSYNDLEGPLPQSIGTLKDLRFADFSFNEFTGKLPVEIGSLTKLVTLHLENNTFSGEIPREIRNLINLTYLYLNNNQFGGNIPSEFTYMSLDELYLQWNDFSGAIPEELGYLDLLVLDISHNNLTGSVPASFEYSPSLREFNLSSNHLRGYLPIEITTLVNLCTPKSDDFFCDQTPAYGLDISANHFIVPQREPVQRFLDIKDPDWVDGQNIFRNYLPITIKS